MTDIREHQPVSYRCVECNRLFATKEEIDSHVVVCDRNKGIPLSAAPRGDDEPYWQRWLERLSRAYWRLRLGPVPKSIAEQKREAWK